MLEEFGKPLVIDELDLADPRAGEVLVSGTVFGTVVGGPFSFADRGFHELKGVPGRWPLFSLGR